VAITELKAVGLGEGIGDIALGDQAVIGLDGVDLVPQTTQFTLIIGRALFAHPVGCVLVQCEQRHHLVIRLAVAVCLRGFLECEGAS
jgi:hypothetical protein